MTIEVPRIKIFLEEEWRRIEVGSAICHKRANKEGALTLRK